MGMDVAIGKKGRSNAPDLKCNAFLGNFKCNASLLQNSYTGSLLQSGILLIFNRR